MYIVISCFRGGGSIDVDEGKDAGASGEEEASHDGQNGEDGKDLLRNQI